MYIFPGNFRSSLAIYSWLSFAISLTFYWITADPGVSYWDCPEYVTVASKMEVGHPPGNPLWMLVMRVATIPFSPQYHAYAINLWSGIFMAFAVFFLCRIIYLPLSLFFNKLTIRRGLPSYITNLLSGLVATGSSLSFAFCDSTWFSAVEAEVYAMSAFLTALSLWIMILWWKESEKGKQTRLLVLLIYITGLSLGVHQLNLLLIPVFALVVLYKKYPGKINPTLILSTILASIAFIGFILLAFIPGILFGAESFELFSVNQLGLPYDSGVFVFSVLTLILIIICLIFSYHPLSPLSRNKFFQTSIWIFSFLLLGLSSFGVIMIRAKGAPFMNEGSPDNIFALSPYILREQYPSSPLFYGETPYSQPILEETIIDGKPVYSRYALKKGKGIYQPVATQAKTNYRSGMLSHNDSLENQRIIENQKGYILSDYKFSQVLTPELNMWFPRITSRDVNDRIAYEDWGGMSQESMDKIPISEVVDSHGHYLPKLDLWGKRSQTFSYRPSYYHNLRYFLSYQSYYMYFRYLFWNFIGRQNDFPSKGEIEHGNFITGFPLIDKYLIGDTQAYPSEIWEGNKGRNRYFGIPFILGIMGIFFLAYRSRISRRYLTFIFLLFLMTGMAIVVYLNQLPGEPRERDYTFLGSYMAFAMWIGAGMIAIVSFLFHVKIKKLILPLSILIALGPPALMVAENFDDHDRRNRFEPTFYASSILDFEFPSIIFSHGDNSTFPLWYGSEVLNMGNDHSVLDITYLSLPSYIENLKKQTNKGIQTLAKTGDITFGKYLLTKVPHDSVSHPIPIEKALKELYNSKESTPELSTSLVLIPKASGDSLNFNIHDLTKGSSFLSFKHLMLLDLIASYKENGKALFFPSLMDFSFYQPLDSILKPALFGKIYAPDLPDSTTNELLKKSLKRELTKLEKLDIRSHYVDPVIADRSVRYRGELIIAANELLNHGEVDLPVQTVKAIEEIFPYENLLPGTFTVTDSTFYEGKEFVKLNQRLYEITGDKTFQKTAVFLDSLIFKRHQEWLKFYHSLYPSQRKTLSNRSKRLLIK